MSRVRLATRLFAHLETWRPYTVFYIGLVGLAGAALADASAAPWRYAVAWAVPTLAWIGGLYGGDYFDRELDRIAKPARPIPSGRMAAGTAWAAMWICVAGGAALAAVANPRTVLVAVAALAAGIGYSRLLKAHGVLGNLVRGGMTAAVVVFGGMVVTTWPTAALLLPAAAVWAHDAASNLVGTIRDVDGDRAGGYRTVPVQHGIAAARRLAFGCYLLAATLAVATVLTAEGARVAAAALAGIALLAGGRAFGLIAALAAEPPGAEPAAERGTLRVVALRAHSILLVERVVLAGAFVTLGLGAVVGLAATAAAALATVVAERALRQRHERDGAPEQVTADDVDRYVDTQLARLSALERPLRGLVSWRRLIRVVLTDLDHEVRLISGDGTLRRADEPDDRPEVVVTTTGTVFADVFLTRRSNPRRAFLARRLRFDGSAADMVHANAIFAEFLRSVPEPAPTTASRSTPAPVVTSLRAPEPAPAATLLPARVVLGDTTLRDGEQMPGVAFSVAQKVEIALLLDRLGVGLVEAGFPAVSAAEAAAVREVAALGLSAVTQAIARPLESDVDAAVRAGVDSVAIFVGTSDAHVLRKLRTTRPALLERVATAVAHAKSAGVAVVFAAEDAVRTDLDFLLEMYGVAIGAGADAVGVADTAGVAHPAGFAHLVRTVADAVSVPVGVHCHDDLGLATANSLAGLGAGASGAQGSVLGVGERAGNAALEELALALEVAHGIDTGLDLTAFVPLANAVSAATGVPIPVNKPVLGRHAFTHESGLHVDGLLRDPSTYEPYPPERIGATRQIVLGKHSGRSCVEAVLEQHGVTATEQVVGALLRHVKDEGERGRSVDPAALLAAVEAVEATAGAPGLRRTAR